MRSKTNAKQKWQKAYIALGSNLGNRWRNLKLALQYLIEQDSLVLEKKSSIYETSPMGPQQRDYLNQAVLIRTRMSPLRLLAILKQVEKRMGRKKVVKWGPRIIDLDLIFYGQSQFYSPKLKVPHPEFHKRKFVLAPLSEIAPDFRPPGFDKTLEQLARELTDPSQKVRLTGRLMP